MLLFVCKGNIYRSQLAAYLARQKFPDVEVASASIAGTKIRKAPRHRHIREYNEEWPKAKQALEKFGVTCWDTLQKPLSDKIIARVNLIVVFNTEEKQWVLELFPEYREKVFLLNELAGKKEEIADPGVQPLAQYLKSTSQIVNYLEDAKGKILSLLHT